MNILVLNCGSSSLKYQLINMDDESVIAKGLVERIGIEGSILTHKPTGKDKYVVETPMKDHNIAVKLVLDALMDAEHGVIKSTDEIAAVGHRVLHAGEKYIESCIVTEDVKKVVRECFDLGPLHNPANLIVLRLLRLLCQVSQMWLYGIQHSVEQWSQRHIFMLFLVNIMRNMA